MADLLGAGRRDADHLRGGADHAVCTGASHAGFLERDASVKHYLNVRSDTLTMTPALED